MQHCDQCQKTKRKFDHPAEELHRVPVPNSSWKQIGIDFIGPLPTKISISLSMFRQFVSARTHRACYYLHMYVCLYVCNQSNQSDKKLKNGNIDYFSKWPEAWASQSNERSD